MTKKELTSPIVSTLKAEGEFVDNSISGSLKRLSISKHLPKTSSEKVSGASISEILYLTLVAPLVKNDSTWAFCSKFINQWKIGQKDVVYRFLLREDINWASLQLKLATSLAKLRLNKVDVNDCAFVVDCSKKKRSGKVEGSSHLYDPATKRVFRSQQAIALGLVWPKGFIPLVNQFCFGKKKFQSREKDFKDGRSEVAKAYQKGIDLKPNQLLKSMLKRALRSGIKAKWLIGDSGYGQKENIALALDNKLDALFLMKRDYTKYRVNGRLLNAKELYKLFRRCMKPTAEGRFRSYAINAELNLGKHGEPEHWIPVQLMLSRPKYNQNKNGWVLSLCTNMDVSVDRMIELYLMRWSIEVFFKECKQNLGWLNNQSGNFISSYGSLHLSSIRYLLLLDAALNSGDGERGLVDVRKQTEEHLNFLCYMGLLWEWFIKMIFGWLDELKNILGKSKLEEIKIHLAGKLDEFIELAFQIDINSAETVPDEESYGF